MRHGAVWIQTVKVKNIIRNYDGLAVPENLKDKKYVFILDQRLIKPDILEQFFLEDLVP